MTFPIHGVADAPEQARDRLAEVERRYGFVPNLIGIMAGSPSALDAYVSSMAAFGATDLNAEERHVVLLTASRINGCEYCMAAHTMSATAADVSDVNLRALRAGSALFDARLDALARLTSELVEHRGRPSEKAVDRFLALGYTTRHILDVLVGISLKTLSNYVNHVAETPLDELLERHAWHVPATTAVGP